MSFFERYEKVCLDHGVKPMSEQAAQKIGVKRATISAWKTKGTTPISDTVTAIAEAYGVSPDYLLGRSDDPAGNGTKNTAAQKMAAAYPIIALYERLDDTDRMKAEAFIQGLLAQDKYAKRKLAL